MKSSKAAIDPMLLDRGRSPALGYLGRDARVKIGPWIKAGVGVGIACLITAAPFVLWRVRYRAFCESRFAAINFGAHQAGGCFEFWLNRYQTSIAAFVGLLVAVGTGVLVYRQWIEARSAAAFNRRAILREALGDAAALVKEVDQSDDDVRSAHESLGRLLSTNMGRDPALLKNIERLLQSARMRADKFSAAPTLRSMIYPIKEITIFSQAIFKFCRLGESIVERSPRIDDQVRLKLDLSDALGGVLGTADSLLNEISVGTRQLNQEIRVAEVEMSKRLERSATVI